jgi:hypothetical protein
VSDFSADLDVFLADFGKPCSTASLSGFMGILDMPGELLTLGQADAVSVGYTLLLKTADATAAGLRSGVAVVHNGVSYTAKERLPEDDGAFTRFTLRK